MSCETWVYRMVDANAFRSLKQEALKQQCAIPDTPFGKFNLKVSGVSLTFVYNWNRTNRVLKLTCVDKPALLPCSMIKSYADTMVTKCGGVV